MGKRREVELLVLNPHQNDPQLAVEKRHLPTHPGLMLSARKEKKPKVTTKGLHGLATGVARIKNAG